jgi:hypothetical protein
MMVIQIIKATWPGIYLGGHSVATEHALSSSCLISTTNKATFTSHANPKYFFFHPSHHIFGRMHEVLNIGKK